MTVNNEVTVTNQGTPQPQGPQQMEIQTPQNNLQDSQIMVQPQQALAAQQQFAPQQTLPQQQFATQQTFPQQQVNPQLQMYGQNQIMPAPGYAPMMMQAAPEKKKKRRVTFGSKSVLTECSDCEEEVDTTVKGKMTNDEICCMIVCILLFWPAT